MFHKILLAYDGSDGAKLALDKIAEITEQLLIVETHELDQNVVRADHCPGAPPSPSSLSEYLRQASRWFPCYRILGRTDGQRRAVIAFAKDELALAAGLKASVTEVESSWLGSPQGV